MARAKKVIKTGPTKAELWAVLAAAAEASGNSLIRDVWMAAEGNAQDTFVDNGRADDILDLRFADELAELAYGSLSFTGTFNENENVRDFYEALGYRW